jgi:MFS superfamily sulfate permease-like transporter
MTENASRIIWPWPLFRPLRGAFGAGLGFDLIAGLTLAAIAVPEQMATARLGGFSPRAGFAAFIAASLAFAVFGANRRLSAGADSTITPIFAGSLAAMAAVGSPSFIAFAAILALMVGAMVTLAGVFKLGWVANLLSLPVITGFLAGIALHIVLSQAPAVLGLPEESGTVYQRLAALWGGVRAIHPLAMAIGLGVFAVTWTCEKLSARIPGALIALVGAALATAAFGLERRGVAVLGAASGGAAPTLTLPHASFEGLLPLVGLAFVVSLVVMVQTAATTRSFSGAGEDPDVDRDFIGVGAGCVLAGLAGAFPVNASPPRTAMVAESGGRSQVAGLVAALAVLLLAAFGARLLAQVPVAALGGVLFFVAQRIFHVGVFADIARRAPAEFALAVATTVLIVALPIQTGVAVGVFLSLAHGVFTTTRARPILFERVADTTVWWPASTAHPGEREPEVLVMGFQAPLSFLNAHDFRRGVLEAIAAHAGRARLFVLEASGVVEIDFTAATLLAEVVAKAREAGMDFAVARLESVRAQATFERFGVTDLVGSDHVFHSVEAAIRGLAGSRQG